MRDLGHPLHVGVLLPVDAADPGAPRRVARAAEDGGLDLVFVPDFGQDSTDSGQDVALDAGPDGGPGTGLGAGPGSGPGGVGLDPWTVLAHIAAATRSIGVATYGLRTLDRPPTVLARAAVGLDQLSGGRLALGLATGSGGRDADAVDALAEAAAVIRGMWDVADPSALVVDGRHHLVPGAQRGPAPAHEVPLWFDAGDDAELGASATLARHADGWWLRAHDGSAPAVRSGSTAGRGSSGPSARAAEQDALDSTLITAGRDPREVRRGLVLDASTAPSVDALAGLVLDEGVATLVLAGLDADGVTRFAADVLPALRARVAAERAARGTVVGTVRSAAVRAARSAGIDYDAIPAALADAAVEPGDVGYASVRSTYLRGGRPGLVLRPAGTAQVVEALAWARTQHVPLAIRSAGHGISGRSTNDGGIVLDLSRMSAIEVLDVASRRVRIEPGARWGEVAAALQPYGWALTSGDFGGVGVGGLATAGGIGFLVREHGLTLDHLRAVEVVLADGRVLRASDEENPDLFWGVRGAGGNLGIVTSLEFEVAEVGDVGFAQLVFDASDTAQFLVDWGATVEAAPRDTTAFVLMGPPRGGTVVAQVMAMVDSDDPATIIDRLQPFARIAPLLQQQVQVLPYSAVVSVPDERHTSEGEPVTRTAMAEHLTPALAADLERLVRSGATPFFQIRAAGGAVHDVPADATAYAHRSANFSLVAFGTGRSRIDAVWDAMAGHFDGLYVSFETDLRPERLADAFPGGTLDRLRRLKRRYDPQDVFRHNFSVGGGGLNEPDDEGVLPPAAVG